MNESPALRILATLFLIGLVSVTAGCLGQNVKQSGVFVSRDNGQSWNATPDLTAKSKRAPKVFPPVAVTAVAVSPHDRNFVVAGTADDLFKTTDGGSHWERLTGKLPVTKKAIAVQVIRFDPVDKNTFYVGGVSSSYGKIFKSTDGGGSLQDVFTVSQPSQSITALLIQGGPSAAVTAGDQLGGVYRSGDAGTSWRKTATLGEPLTALTTSGGVIFAATSGGGIYKSADAVSFAPVNAGLSGHQLTVWALASGLGGLYAGTDNGLLLSRDEGASWQTVTTPLVSDQPRVQALALGGSSLYLASNAVVYQYNPGAGTFVPVQLKAVRQVYALSVSQEANGPVYAAGNNTSNDFNSRFGLGLPGFQLKSAPG